MQVTPGVLEVDANQDGAPEWSFNATGYGNFGQQTVFSSGNATEALGINPNQGTVVCPTRLRSSYRPVQRSPAAGWTLTSRQR